MANVRRHLGIIREFGMPAVVAVNRRPGDTDDEVEFVKRAARRGGRVRAPRPTTASPRAAPAPPISPPRSSTRASSRTTFRLLYEDDAPIREKIEAVAKRVYGAAGRLLLPRGGEAARHSSRRRARAASGLHGQDAPVAVGRPDAAERAGGLHAPGARRPRLHRRGLARAAVRRHHADARARASRRPRSTSTSTRTGAPSGCSSRAAARRPNARGAARRHRGRDARAGRRLDRRRGVRARRRARGDVRRRAARAGRGAAGAGARAGGRRPGLLRARPRGAAAARDDPARAGRLRDALSAASEMPLAVSEVGCEVAELAAGLAPTAAAASRATPRPARCWPRPRPARPSAWSS